jgi:hypothetical protein
MDDMPTRNGKFCNHCGHPIFDWQYDEFEVFPSLCPECSLGLRDDGYDDETENYLSEMII